MDRKLKGLSCGIGKGYGVKHGSPFVPRKKCVVYLMPFPWGHVYIVQTSRCINVRLLEHKRSLGGNTYSHAAQHVSKCKCKPAFQETVILSVRRDKLTREIIEAYNIGKKGVGCFFEFEFEVRLNF